MENFYGVTIHHTGNKALYKVYLYSNKVVFKKFDDNGVGNDEVNKDNHKINGSILGIMKNDRGFVTFNSPARNARPDLVKRDRWGYNTPPLAGLFLNWANAKTAFESESLTHWDTRFIDESIEIIKEIANMEDENPFVRLDCDLSHAYTSNRLKDVLVP